MTNPEYLHVLLHPVVIVGLSVALLCLLAGLVLREAKVRLVGLVLVPITSLAAWPLLSLGQSAYNRVRPLADDDGKAWLRQHMNRAETWVPVFYATTALAVLGVGLSRRKPRAATVFTVLTLVAGSAAVGTGAWIAKAGGQVRHPEFRADPAPANHSDTHEHTH
jgi:hypothetical protein